MVTLKSILVFTTLISAALSMSMSRPRPAWKGTGRCKKIHKRKSWHNLSIPERKAYLAAEKCLMTKKQKVGLPHAISIYDSLTKSHQLQADFIHNDGFFLPYHRLHLYAHEKLLREECGYMGAQPYWEETLDAKNIHSSILFNPHHGFGGNGNPAAQGCVTDGPFANAILPVGPGVQNIPHCLTRSFNTTWAVQSRPEVVNRCLSLKTFALAWPCIEGGFLTGMPDKPVFIDGGENPHTGGHGGVGGEMGNPISSPGDPIFNLHHGYIDKLWDQWQRIDPKNNLYDIAGYTTWLAPPVGQQGFVNVTLEHRVHLYGIVPSMKVGQLMDSRAWPICAEYV